MPDTLDDVTDLEQIYEQAVSETQAESPDAAEPPVETTPPTPEPDTESRDETPPAQTLVRDALKAKGYDVDAFDDDDKLIDYMSQGWDRAQHAPDAAELDRLKKIEQEYYRSQKTPTEPPKTEAAPPVSKWSPPPMSDRASKMMDDGLVGRTDDGKLGVFNSVSKSFEYDPRYERELTEVEDHIAWQANAQRRLTRDPIGALKDAGLLDVVKQELGLDKLREQLKEELRTETRQAQESKTIDDYWKQNRTQYLELDAKGEIKTRLENGQKIPIPNARGQAYIDAFETFTSAGVPEYTAHEKAIAISSRVVPPAAPLPPPEDKKKAFLTKARESGKRNGHTPTNRVFPDLATAATHEPEQPRRLEDVWLNSLEDARAEN